MSITEVLTLFIAMCVLAAVPSVSVLVVTARSASAGFTQGAVVALGVVAGDLILVALALGGLALIGQWLDWPLDGLLYLGGAYLIVLGLLMWRGRKGGASTSKSTGAGHLGGFASGLFITLGDQKALLFYLGFLPAFIDPGGISTQDMGLVIAIVLIAVGGVKLGYAWLACRLGRQIGERGGTQLKTLAALLLLGAGMWLLARASGSI